jgi:hypothetical protein
MTRNLSILVLVLALPAAFAGCAADETDYVGGPAAAQQQDALREDTNTVTVPAGKGIEFKLIVQQGDSFEYEWTSNTVLFYDFHGEREGDTSGAFTSHKAGNAPSDGGTLTAPFTGTHGWYWENERREPVTVTVWTSGVYEVKGIVR